MKIQIVGREIPKELRNLNAINTKSPRNQFFNQGANNLEKSDIRYKSLKIFIEILGFLRDFWDFKEFFRDLNL